MAEDFAAVAKVLWEDWDPIGVRDMGAPDNEYDSYVPAVVQLLKNGANADAVAAHLTAVACDRMELDAHETSRRAAEKLVALGIGR